MSISGFVQDDGSVRTICKDCLHCVIDKSMNGNARLEYAKCMATITPNLEQINVISGKKRINISRLEYCTSKNDGYCEDYLPKAKQKNIPIDENGVPVWEGRQPEPKKQNPWTYIRDLFRYAIYKVEKFVWK